MSKTETVQRLRQQKSVSIAEQMKRLEEIQANPESLEELARTIEPLAQAMYALTEDSRNQIETSQKHQRQIIAEMEERLERWESERKMVEKKLTEAAGEFREAAEEMTRANAYINIKMMAMAIVVGVLSAIAAPIVSQFLREVVPSFLG